MRVHRSTSLLRGNRPSPPSCLLMAGVQETWTPTQPGLTVRLKQSPWVLHCSCKIRLLTVLMYCFPKCYWTKRGLACPSAVKPIYWHQVVVKESAHWLQAPSKEFRQLVLKRPRFPEGAKKRFLKTGWGRGVMGYATSSWTAFWLTGGEVSKRQRVLLVPTGLGSPRLCAAYS